MEIATGKQQSIETPQEMQKKKVRTVDCEYSNTLHLPHDIIIYDILTRVPIDSLTRFRCVCKLWSDVIINDPVFIKLHSSRIYSDRGFIWISENYDADDDGLGEVDLVVSSVIVFYDIDKKEKKVFQFSRESGLANKRRLRIVDSLNGLVLLSGEEDGFATYHVYNPITGYSIQLRNISDTASRRNQFNFQLAYDSVMGKYKVLSLSFANIFGGGYFFKIVTLGVESETWRDLVVPELYPRLDYDFIPMFACGSFYWLTHQRNTKESNSSDDQRNIVALDVSEEKFYTINYPKGALSDCKLLEMDGSLCFLDYTSTGKFRLWVLMGDKNNYEWKAKYIVDDVPSLSGLVLPTDYESDCFYAIVTNPTVKIIFSSYSRRSEPHIYSYDIQQQRLDSIFRKSTTSHQWHLNRLANF